MRQARGSMTKKKAVTQRPTRSDGEATKRAILEAAEVIFASHGFEGTPMREIAKRANVKQSLVHYHFETKDYLWEEVVRRRSTAINAFRQKQLEELFSGGTIPTLERVLEAFYAPNAYTHGGSIATMVPYSQVALAITMGSDERSKLAAGKFFDGIALIFIEAFQKCVPGLSLADAVWGYLFALGARAHVHAKNDRAKRLSNGTCDNEDLKDVVKRVIPFAAAGIRNLAATSDQPAKPASIDNGLAPSK